MLSGRPNMPPMPERIRTRAPGWQAVWKEIVDDLDGAIRAKIRKLIRDEDPAAPLSDSRIAEILSGEGIPVARRTVAKYRETMGLSPSNERRRVNGK